MLPFTYALLNYAILALMAILLLWWGMVRPDMDRNVMLVSLGVLAMLWAFVNRLRRPSKRRFTPPQITQHFLLANDRQGFMRDLRLDAKTVIFDGSNIYHFGHDHKLDAQPLGMIVHQLRDEGYRIVCFFDANIFYTVQEHGAFPSGQHHSVALLQDIFGLRKDEIYVVPGGVQADKYVLESLKHLPVSFAVTNDQFRDYAKDYPTVMKGNQWRKSMRISKNEIKLTQHRFKAPVYLN